MKVRQMMKRRQRVARINKVHREYEEWSAEWWVGFRKFAEEMTEVLKAFRVGLSKAEKIEASHES